MEGEGAASASDAALPSPAALLHATDRVRDAQLANAVNTTEVIWSLTFTKKKGHLILRLLVVQLLLDNLRAVEASALRSQGNPQQNHCAPAQAIWAAAWGNSNAHLQFMERKRWKSSLGDFCARLLGGVSGKDVLTNLRWWSLSDFKHWQTAIKKRNSYNPAHNTKQQRTKPNKIQQN